MNLLQWKLLPLLTLLASIFLFFYLKDPSDNECSLLPHKHFWITSKRIVTPQGVISGAVEINGGKIVSIVKEEEKHGKIMGNHVVDYADAVVMPGLVDVHVHLDDPGRSEWEGFPSGTKAAAAGFWGGLVPENAFNASALENLLKAGALGLKSFMCPSGINDFPMTNITHIKEGLSVLAKYKRPLLVHSEIEQSSPSPVQLEGSQDDPRTYSTYLATRPPSWEEAAVRELLKVTSNTRPGGPAEGAHIHVAHLSDSGSTLERIKEAKRSGDSVSVETCTHYLAFSEEDIKDGDTRFKCAPPIRDKANKEKLWDALMEGHIDMLSSDHSPTVPHLKLPDSGDFLKAWGGVSSLQFDLSATWSHAKKRGVTMEQIALWWSERPAKLAGLELKGAIAIGKHADIVAWAPDEEYDVNDIPVYLKHPSISAYMGMKLSGKVLATFVRGQLVYEEKHAPAACGTPILARVTD